MSKVRRMCAVVRAESGLATAGLVTIIAAVVGGAALGALLVVGGVVDPIAESATTVQVSTVPVGTVPDATTPASTVPRDTVSALTANVQLLDCRAGNPVGSVIGGDAVFVVGRDATGEWAAIRRPGALAEIGWLPLAFLEYDQDISVVPVTPCGVPQDDAEVSYGDTSSTTTTTAPPDTTIPPPDTTIPPPDTTIPPPEGTIPPDTTIPPPEGTIPPDTEAPIVEDLLIEPDTIYPGAEPDACEESPDTPIFGSAYATVPNEVDQISVTLTWMYLPDSYEYSGSFPVSVEPTGFDYQLTGSIADLPQPYRSGISAPQIVVELTWTVIDSSGNSTTVVDTFDLGRCV